MFAVNVKFLISLLSRTVGPENRRLLRIVSFDINLGRHCPPSPGAPLCFQDVLFWIKDKHEVEKVDLYLKIKKKLVRFQI